VLYWVIEAGFFRVLHPLYAGGTAVLYHKSRIGVASKSRQHVARLSVRVVISVQKKINWK
jgi:hypothetical protein